MASCRNMCKCMRSGVVQGSVLGPILFVLYINDVIDHVGTAPITKLFADDMKLYIRVKLFEPSTLASGFAKREEWSKLWQLGINEGKSSVMHLGDRVSVAQYRINNLPLPSVNAVCDLGVKYNDKKCFRGHIGNITSKAYQRIYLMLRCFISRSVEHLTRAYTTYVRPLLEY